MVSINQLKKFQVKELKDIMRDNNIKGLSGKKVELITRIVACPDCAKILKPLSLPIRKKKVFSEKQIAHQQRFAEQNKKYVKGIK